MKKAKYFSF